MEKSKSMPTPTSEELEKLRAHLASLEAEEQKAAAEEKPKSAEAEKVSVSKSGESKILAEENLDDSEAALVAVEKRVEEYKDQQERMKEVEDAEGKVNFDNSEEALRFKEKNQAAGKSEKEAEEKENEPAEKIKIAEKDELEIKLSVARLAYVDAWREKEKIGKLATESRSKMDKLLTLLKIKGKSETTDEKTLIEKDKKFKQSQDILKSALKEINRHSLGEKEEELKSLVVAGKMNKEDIDKELEKYAEQIIIVSVKKESNEICNLRDQRKIEEMGEQGKWLKEKIFSAVSFYRRQHWGVKMAISGGLFGLGVGAGLVGGATGAAILSGVFVGRWTQRVFGGAATAVALESKIKSSQEKHSGKEISKEFAGKFLESLRKQNSELDDKLFEVVAKKRGEEVRRYILAGTAGTLIGSGALADVFRNAWDWLPDGMKEPIMKGISNLKDSVFGVKPALNLGQPPIEPGEQSATISGNERFHEAPLPSVKAIEALPIGSRGPEGTMIDFLKNHQEFAKSSLGWDGKAPFKNWVGVKAHELWQEYARDEIAKPETLAKLQKLGYSPDFNGYQKMMTRIGSGSLEISPEGKMKLSNVDFLKAKDVPISGEVPKFAAAEVAPESETKTPQPEMEILKPGTDEFYKEQLDLEKTEISPEEKLEVINNSIETVEGKIKEIQSSLNDVYTPEEIRNSLKAELKDYNEHEALLNNVKESGAYNEPLIIEQVLPPRIMETESFKSIMRLGEAVDWKADQKEFVDKLFFKYFGQSFKNFGNLPVELRNKALFQLGQNMEKIMESDQIAASAAEINLPHKAYLWRNAGEMKWVQDIWDKFGGGSKNKI